VFRRVVVCASMPFLVPPRTGHDRETLAMVIASDLRSGMIVEVDGQQFVKEGELIRIEVATGRYLKRVKEPGKR
jgi:hypothetical protein